MAVVGAGPTGMMLAAELALAEVDVVLLEQRSSQQLPGSRAGGLHARSIEVLDQRGVAERFLAAGRPAQVAQFAMVPLDLTGFPTRHPYGLALWQKQFEQILAGWLEELGVDLRYDRQVTAVMPDTTHVRVELHDNAPLQAQYVVACDGGRSPIRRAVGIDFAGWDATVSNLVAEVRMAAEPQLGMRHDELGIHGMGRLDDTGLVRVVVTERVLRSGEASERDLRHALTDVYGTDFGVQDVVWLSRFTDATRQATAYRAGRVLLAGDAAHIHYPVGGQGLNLGLQDAVNLGWKLAQVVHGASPDSLLDTYQDERHPPAARVMRTTMAQVALRRSDDRTKAAAATVAELLGMEEPRRRYAGMMSGLDLHYELPGAGEDPHPLVGRRMPDLDLDASGDGGSLRVYSLLHQAKPVLLELGRPPLDAGPWAARVPLVRARFNGSWELPVLGEVPAPTGVLVRPDGYVAWVGHGDDAGLTDALRRWFGEVLPPETTCAR